MLHIAPEIQFAIQYSSFHFVARQYPHVTTCLHDCVASNIMEISVTGYFAIVPICICLEKHQAQLNGEIALFYSYALSRHKIKLEKSDVIICANAAVPGIVCNFFHRLDFVLSS